MLDINLKLEYNITIDKKNIPLIVIGESLSNKNKSLKQSFNYLGGHAST